MSKDNSPPPTAIPSAARRASFSPGQISPGQKFSDIFGRSPTNNGNGLPNYSSPIATAAANAQAQQRRRMSITSLGLSGSPTQASAFASLRARQDSGSLGTSPTASIDENAVDDGDVPLGESPSSPFARRMSFGARALRDVKSGNGNHNGEGFNWSEQIRSRAERSSSISAAPGPPAPREAPRASVPVTEPPIKEIPKNPRAPDAFQERILKGDFYMD